MTTNSRFQENSDTIERSRGVLPSARKPKCRDTKFMAELTDKEQAQLKLYREQIEVLDFVPLSDIELVEIKERRIQAEANAAIEGLYGSPFNHEIRDLFEELAVPETLRLKILDDVTQWKSKNSSSITAE